MCRYGRAGRRAARGVSLADSCDWWRFPLSLTLIAAATVGLDALAVIPVTVAVVTAYLFLSVVRYLAARRSEASAPA